MLLSGDHLLPGITPPVTFERGFDADPLRSYLTSLRAVADLRPRLVLPGHGTPFGDPQGRIEAILRTKLRRLEKIRRAIREQPRSIVELADLLVAKAVLAHQRQLAINETLAHVAYLRWSGVVERRTPARRGLRVVRDRGHAAGREPALLRPDALAQRGSMTAPDTTLWRKQPGGIGDREHRDDEERGNLDQLCAAGPSHGRSPSWRSGRWRDDSVVRCPAAGIGPV